MAKRHKYIFVTGGVMSGVGKGIAASSISLILQARGLTVTALKIDPYINVDAGTMNPTEHGEVFVLDDGDETDQDMGNYERFLNTSLSRVNYMTTGRVYLEVIRKERNLEYKGKNVEVVPDIPLEVISRIEKAAKNANADVTVVEIGGTIGEYQNIIFLEAARMMKTRYPEDVGIVMVSYLPAPSKIGEMKTKPTQTAARTLNSVGLQADVILARSNTALDQKRKDKIAIFCNIRPENVISAPDVESIYDVPINFEKDKLGEILCKVVNINHKKRVTDLSQWNTFVNKVKKPRGVVNIAVVGKYFDSGSFVLSDVYISILEALKFSAFTLGRKPVITYLNSKSFETGELKLSVLSKYDGVLVPGGFGSTGVEGKIKVIEYVRKKKIPYFGICYGMQLAVVEFARNVLGWKDAHTTEINPSTKHPVIDIMHDQKGNLAEKKYGATMRLGAYPCELKEGTQAKMAYKKEIIFERHRHRYEVNPNFVSKLEDGGLIFSGTSPDHRLMEIAELPEKTHPFFVGAQFHPEFLARPLVPHPLFSAFIKASIKKQLGK
ncbi:MAG TPA: CTP synthase [Candidatus Nanoarchaeia archaeon]|nr:CTP synthase [Candidatus Nanoarchaeia archaeon]